MKALKNTRLRTKTRKRRHTHTRTRKRRQRGSGSAKKVGFKRTQKVCKFEILKDAVKLTISYETANIPCEVCLPDETEIMREEIVDAGETDMILKEINVGVSRIFAEDIVNLEEGGFFDVSNGVNNETYKAMVVSAKQLKEAVAQLMDKPTIENPLPQTIYRTLLKILHQGENIPNGKIRDMNAALINKMIAIYIKNLTSDHLAYQESH